MGIHPDIDPLTEADIDDLVDADELLADALAKFAEGEFSKANRRNRDRLGDWVPYTVTVDGQTVYEGRGEVFPERQIAQAFARRSQRERQRDANVELGRRIRRIVVDWIWEKADERLLARLVETLLRIRHGYHRAGDASDFVQTFAFAGGPDAADLLTYLFERWFARRRLWFRALQDVRAVYRIYRLLRIIAAGGSGDADADDDHEELLRCIAGELIALSPVVSGAYQAGHMLFVDARRVASADEIEAGAEIPVGRVYAFVATVPYARRLETGLAKSGPRRGQPFIRQGEPHLYERVAQAAQRRASNADVRFNYTDLAGGRTRPRSGARHQLLFPTIIVTFR